MEHAWRMNLPRQYYAMTPGSFMRRDASRVDGFPWGKQDKIACSRLSIDILNEPDNRQLGWGVHNGHPALTQLYLRTMDAVYKVNPHMLMFVEVKP